MKLAIVVALFAVIAVVVANPYASAVNDATSGSTKTLSHLKNTLDLGGQYEVLKTQVAPIIQQLTNEIKEKITQLDEAIAQEKAQKEALDEVWEEKKKASEQAQQALNQAETAVQVAYDAQQVAIDTLGQLEAPLAGAEKAYQDAVAAQAELEGTVQTLRDSVQQLAEVVTNDNAEFEKIIDIFGPQNN